MAKEISLYPELVKDVIDELLEMDIISKKQIKNLKRDNKLKIDDPNVKMDLRHELVKVEQKTTRKVMRTRNTMNKRLTKIQDSKVKCLKVIDQEIQKFVKKLKIEHKQIMLAQNKQLTFRREACQPLIDNYIPHMSNITELQLGVSKLQKPFDLSEFGNVCLTPEPIELKGRPVLSAPTARCQTILENDSTSDRPPNNTPINFKKLCDSGCPLSICVAKKVQDINVLNHEKSIVIKVHKKWKAYVIKRKENRLKTEQENKILLKKCFSTWLRYCQKQETERNSQRQLKQNENEKKIYVLINRLLEKQKQVLVSKVTPGEDLLRKKTHIQSESSPHCSKLKTKLDSYINKTNNSPMINGKINSEQQIICPDSRKVKNLSNVLKQNKNLESMQKKIVFQNEVIDKQKEQIKHQTQQLELFQIKLLYLSAKFHEVKATERLKQERSQQCNSSKKVTKEEVTMRSIAQRKEDETNNNERVNNFVKRMEERAEECRKRNLLAKERKEQKEKEKIKREQELEEQKLKEQQEIKKKKFQEKKEQIKLQRLDELQKYLDTQKEKQLMSLASNHYFKALLKKTFKGFRMIMINSELLDNQCKDFYNKKLLKNYFKLWKKNASDSAMKKEKLAINFYNKTLLIKSWKFWIRVSLEKLRSKI